MARDFKSTYRSIRGFTLIETIIVLVIAGIFLGIIASLAKPYFVERQRSRTVDAVRSIEQALADYVINVNAYPCPAPLNTPRGAAEDGAPQCAAGPGITETLGRDGRVVLIGAVPYRALEIPVDATIDAHKNRLTYAVTLASTDPATYIDNPADLAFHSGGIDVVDSGGNTLLSVAETAHAFFFSHGADGKGSHTDGGIQNAASDCTAGIDAGNCDGDASFVAAMQSYGTEDAYYDDVSTYTLLAEGVEDKLWARSPVSTANIYNINSNNVGIGTNDPQRVLHVAGDTLVEGSLIAENFVQTGEGDVPCSSENVGAIRLRSGAALEYCAGGSWRPLVHDGENVTCSGNRAIKSFDENGNPECGTVGSAVINIPSCPSGVLVGVSNGQPICVDVSSAGPSTPQPLPPDPVPPTAAITCERGQLLQGIDASGNAICRGLTDIFAAEVVRAEFGSGNGGAMWSAKCPSGTIRLGCSLIDRVNPGTDSAGVMPLGEDACYGSSSNSNGPNSVYAICLKVRD